MPTWVQDDGGRAQAGYKGMAGDCVTRAVAIATEMPYQQVYDALRKVIKAKSKTGRGSPRDGVEKPVTRAFLASLGWRFVPTMGFGTGCKVHLKADELPKGRIIAACSHHLVAVIDGIIHDTFDPSRDGTRCVYGYYTRSLP